MKKLPLLQSWTKLLFVLCMLIIIFVPGVIILHLINPGIIPDEIRVVLGESGVVKTIVLFLSCGGYCLFVYALFLFRKVLSLFSQRRFFDDEVIKYFSRIGKLIYYGILLTFIPYNFYLIFTQSHHELDEQQLFDIVFLSSLGLFFTVLSEVFYKAKNIKEENDLTI